MNDEQTTAAAPAQVLTFCLGAEVFGIDIRTVREIIQCGPITTVPMMPRCVCGVINLRGAVVPVLDLKARFGRPATPQGKRSCIVILDVPQGEARGPMGLLVDAVSEVLRLAPADIEPAPDFGTGLRGDVVRGLFKSGSRFVVLLEPDRALDLQDFGDDTRAAPAPRALSPALA